MNATQPNGKLDFKTEDRLNKFIRYLDDKIDMARSNGFCEVTVVRSGFMEALEEPVLSLVLDHYSTLGYEVAVEDHWEGKALHFSW